MARPSRERFVTSGEAAEFLAVSPRTLQGWVHARRVPFHKVGRTVRFRLSELDSWVARQTREQVG